MAEDQATVPVRSDGVASRSATGSTNHAQPPTKASSFARPSENHWEDVKNLFSELSANSVKVSLEAFFLIVWAAVVWGVATVLQLIEPSMPGWAAVMFKYVEIGFALFLLSEMFLRRVDIFERAIVRAGELLAKSRAAIGPRIHK